MRDFQTWGSGEKEEGRDEEGREGRGRRERKQGRKREEKREGEEKKKGQLYGHSPVKITDQERVCPKARVLAYKSCSLCYPLPK